MRLKRRKLGGGILCKAIVLCVAMSSTAFAAHLDQLRKTEGISFGEFFANASQEVRLRSRIKATAKVATLVSGPSMSFAEFIDGKQTKQKPTEVRLNVADLMGRVPTSEAIDPIHQAPSEKTKATAAINVQGLSVPDEIQSLPHIRPSASSIMAEPTLASNPIQVRVEGVEATTEVVTPHFSDFEAQPVPLRTTTLRLRMVDDRSNESIGRLYPVSSLKVSIVGSKMVEVSDALGFVTFADVPLGSRIMIAVHDEYPRIRDTVVEFVVREQKQATAIKLLRKEALATYEAAFGSPQTSYHSVVCGVVVDRSDRRQTLAGVQVGLDVPDAVGPLYFDRFGLMARKQNVTGPDGRFCYFNLAPGPAPVQIFQDGALLATAIVGTYPGTTHHVEIAAFEDFQFSTHLGVVPTVSEQFNSDTAQSNSIKLVDMVDLFPIGRGEPMSYIDAGEVEVVDGTNAYMGRSFALVQASEFENAMVSLEKGQRNLSILYPRGYLEDMAGEANVALNPDLGSVIVEHQAYEDMRESVVIEITDHRGDSVGEGWYMPGYPRTKGFFFNLLPGTYNIKVRTQQGDWVANDVVHVYSETLSTINTGSPIRLIQR